MLPFCVLMRVVAAGFAACMFEPMSIVLVGVVVAGAGRLERVLWARRAAGGGEIGRIAPRASCPVNLVVVVVSVAWFATRIRRCVFAASLLISTLPRLAM